LKIDAILYLDMKNLWKLDDEVTMFIEDRCYIVHVTALLSPVFVITKRNREEKLGFRKRL